jgi:hypothetical protein
MPHLRVLPPHASTSTLIVGLLTNLGLRLAGDAADGIRLWTASLFGIRFAHPE